MKLERIICATLVLVSVSQGAIADGAAMSDEAKISDALRAGPEFITRDATIMDWPSDLVNGRYRVLRKGTSEWTCLPGVPGYPHDEPGCFDRVFLSWIQQSLAGKEPHIDRIGISYMYVGAWVPNISGADHTHDFHVGPHIMIISPHQDDVRGYNTDGSTGLPYVAHLPHGTQLYLVMPFVQAQSHESPAR